MSAEAQSAGRANATVRRALSRTASRDWRARAVRNALLVGLVGTIALFALLSSAFLSVTNFRIILVNLSYTAVVAVPMALLLIAGRVDLSVGSVLALGGVTSGLLITNGVDTALACLTGVLAGAIVGLVNGVLVTRFGLSTIVVTLGSLTAVRGFVLFVSPGPLFNFGDGFRSLGEGGIAGIPYLVMIAAGVLGVGAIVLAQSAVGRHIYAIGVNEEAAYLSGVHVTRICLLLFVATGAAAGLAGVMLAARLGSAPAGSLGVGFELDVLTAVLLGGVAFAGGRGTMRGVLFGLLFLAILKNGLVLLNVPSTVSSMLTGLVLIGAATLDVVGLRGSSTTAPERTVTEGSPPENPA